MTATTATPVDTARVECRSLRFNTIDEALADVDRLVAAERAGRLQLRGNWTLGQIFGHVATWASFPYEGDPPRPPWFVKLIVRPMKRKYIHGSMPRGVKIPRIEGGTLGTERFTTDDGAARLRAALERLGRVPPVRPNTLFGRLTHDEWIQLNLRHAELHLGFACPS